MHLAEVSVFKRLTICPIGGNRILVIIKDDIALLNSVFIFIALPMLAHPLIGMVEQVYERAHDHAVLLRPLALQSRQFIIEGPRINHKPAVLVPVYIDARIGLLHNYMIFVELGFLLVQKATTHLLME